MSEKRAWKSEVNWKFIFFIISAFLICGLIMSVHILSKIIQTIPRL